MVAIYVHSFVSLVFYIFTVVLLSLELLPLKILAIKKKNLRKKKWGRNCLSLYIIGVVSYTIDFAYFLPIAWFGNSVHFTSPLRM